MGDWEKQPLIRNNSVSTFKPFGLFWNIVKSFAGAGTFALPWAIKNAGLWTGVVGVVIVAIFSTYTINTLLRCGQRVMDNQRERSVQKIEQIIAPPSYPEIGRAAIGDLGAVLVSSYSSLMCFGVCIAYFILISDNMHTLIPLSKVEIIWVVFPVVVFLSCLTDLKALAYTSVAGSCALVVAMGAVVTYGFENHLLKPISDYPVLDWRHIPLFMGNAAFLFCDHVVVLPLANSCGDFSRFPTVLFIAVTFVTIINVAFAGLSYAFWVENTCGNVIQNLGDGVVGDIVKVGISLEVLASFPLVSSAGFQSLENVFPEMRIIKAFPGLPPGSEHPFFSRNALYYVFRAGIITVLAVLASTISSFGAFVSLVGSLTIMATGFIFPQIFYLKLFEKELSPINVVWQCLIIAFGVGMTGLGTFQAMEGLIDTLRHKSSEC